MTVQQHDDADSNETAALQALAHDTTARLVRAYRLQDQLEDVETLAAKRQTDTATEAYEQMATVYTREFPRVSTAAARQAGKSHMTALFKQDVIENDPTSSTTDVLGDRRWDGSGEQWTVKDSFVELCEQLEMTDQFADGMTEFFRLHGQNQSGWRAAAHRSHRIKTTRITGSESWGEKLASYFVTAVEHHDNRDWQEGHTVIQSWYRSIFQLTDVPTA